MALCLGLVLAYIAIRTLFPRLDNDRSCATDEPVTPAEIAAFYDARARVEVGCSNSKARCQFTIRHNPDATISIYLYVVKEDFWAGCVSGGYGDAHYVYDREGKFLRAPEMPFG